MGFFSIEATSSKRRLTSSIDKKRNRESFQWSGGVVLDTSSQFRSWTIRQSQTNTFFSHHFHRFFSDITHRLHTTVKSFGPALPSPAEVEKTPSRAAESKIACGPLPEQPFEATLHLHIRVKSTVSCLLQLFPTNLIEVILPPPPPHKKWFRNRRVGLRRFIG